MFSFRVFKVAALLIATSCAWPVCRAQEVIHATQAIECELVHQMIAASPGGGSRLAFLSRVGEDLVAAVRTGTGPAGQSELILCPANEEGRVVARIPFGGRVLAASGRWVFVVEPAQRRVVGRLLNLVTGEDGRMEFPGGIFTASLHGDRLAILTSAGPFNPSGPPALQVYDCNSKQILAQATLGVSSMYSDLYFADADTLLLANGPGLFFTPISLKGGIQAGPAIQLSGSEVEYSRSRARRSLGASNAEKLLLGYIPSRDGNYLFFLSPYKRSDGLRLAKFDKNGKQLHAYRLKLNSGMGGRLIVSMGTVSATEDSIVIGSLQGTGFRFGRPQ